MGAITEPVDGKSLISFTFVLGTACLAAQFAERKTLTHPAERVA